MNTLLKAACLALYAAGAAAAAGWLPAHRSLLAPAAALLLAAHVVEGLAMHRLVRRHPGPLPASLVLTLLFGMLHLLPLRSRATLRHKTVVITGAGSGIGRALALRFAREGAHLALSDINMEGLAGTVKLVRDTGAPDTQQVRAYRLDATSWEAFVLHADEVRRDFGTAHVIINNAGATVVGTVANTTVEEYRWQLDVNMYGVLYGTKAFLPMMLAQREGWIVNISSIFGLLGFPCQSAYNMSKFAVRGLTECLWQELDGSGVQAVCVHPGGIRTNIERAGRRVQAAGAMEATFAAKAEKMLVTPPEHCADDIVNGMLTGQRRIITGYRSSTVHWLTRLLPNSYPGILRRLA